jgi:hypothetical protein
VIERKYLDMFDRLRRDPSAAGRPVEPLPTWLARRRRDIPAAAEILARIPAGAVIDGRRAGQDLSQSA